MQKAEEVYEMVRTRDGREATIGKQAHEQLIADQRKHGKDEKQQCSHVRHLRKSTQHCSNHDAHSCTHVDQTNRNQTCSYQMIFLLKYKTKIRKIRSENGQQIISNSHLRLQKSPWEVAKRAAFEWM